MRRRTNNDWMNKRHFLGTATLAGLWPAVDALAADPARKGPGLLTLSGAIGKSNRGPVDPALDQLLVKHGVKFDKAYVLDSEALLRLPSVRIKATSTPPMYRSTPPGSLSPWTSGRGPSQYRSLSGSTIRSSSVGST